MKITEITDFQLLQRLCADVGIDTDKIKKNVNHPVVQELLRRLRERPQQKSFKPFDWLLGSE